jgi:membrane associated rhomboid family serine protease
VVFHGSHALCAEYSLVLQARGLQHTARHADGAWQLCVPPALAEFAQEEIRRYGEERSVARGAPHLSTPFPGSVSGAALYVIVLLLVAYCAGRSSFGKDWLAAGALEAGARSEWWRSVTALTLHVEQLHLMGNLLFGFFAGLAVGRLFGPGVGWLSILCAGAAANYVEIIVAPDSHRAIGASTAVFAALGLLAGFASRQRLDRRERLWYRWAPIIAGVSLLTLLGSGDAHVDVLGHALGFIFGLGLGWVYGYVDWPGRLGRRSQVAAAAAAVALICLAWLLALAAGGPARPG